jgi:hypothetical protein
MSLSQSETRELLKISNKLARCVRELVGAGTNEPAPKPSKPKLSGD